MVDQLVETTFFNQGLEYYEGGLNILYAQSLFLQAHIFESKSEYTELLERFQKMIRNKNSESIVYFYSKVEEIYNQIEKESEKNFFFPILLSQNYIKDILKSTNKFTIDLALPSLTILSDIWYKNENVQIKIIHDDSKQVEFWKDFIIYMSKHLTDKKVDVGFDERKMIFPLQIESIEMVDSKNHIQIQLSDLIGSSFAYYAKSILLEKNVNDTLANIISNTKLAKMNVHPLQPDMSFFEKDFKSGKNDINPLDFLAEKSLNNKDRFNESYPK